MKFVLLVEGSTEKLAAPKFLKRWLDAHLTQPVGIQVASFNGYADLARKVATKARMYLDQPGESGIIAVVGLMDLFGPNFYPSQLGTVAEKLRWGVNHFQKEVGLDRFRMFFAVHEFEAWLISQPDIFPREVRDLLKKLPPPETINLDQPPAKPLDQVYRRTLGKSYKKTTYGTSLFSKLDPVIAVAGCPYLKNMLDEMLLLARNAGL